MVAVARREVVAVARREVVAVSPPPNKPRNVQYFNIVIDPIWSWVGT